MPFNTGHVCLLRHFTSAIPWLPANQLKTKTELKSGVVEFSSEGERVLIKKGPVLKLHAVIHSLNVLFFPQANKLAAMMKAIGSKTINKIARSGPDSQVIAFYKISRILTAWERGCYSSPRLKVLIPKSLKCSGDENAVLQFC